MKKLLVTAGAICISTLIMQFAACKDVHIYAPAPSPSPSATPTATPTPIVKIRELPITLPLLDALFFVDRRFSERLKSDLKLNDEQIASIRQTVRAETSKMRASESEEGGGRTLAAGELASEKLSEIVGAEKAQQIATLALERWQAAGDGGGDDTASVPLATPTLPSTLDPRGPSPSPTASPSTTGVAGTALTPGIPYMAPADTRIVVNAPAYRMDVFRNGQLVKSYKVAIGYPEFPLPTGMRKANTIVFNPPWVPPDEPWVEGSNKVKIGQKIPAGDKLNPLGVIKIPIGLPSLIHGGKPPARIGTFASHGCVGMTNKQVKEFTKELADLAGMELSDEELARYEKTPTETKSVRLNTIVPVELRYETIAVEDGTLRIFRDVYDRETNVPENLEAVLGTYGVKLSDLTEEERTQVMSALKAMGSPQSSETTAKKRALGQETRRYKGKKEVAIQIAALAGKGYPAPVDLDPGVPPKTGPTPRTGATPKKR
jgi:L,D-transpeptidase ErfK/SrfK